MKKLLENNLKYITGFFFVFFFAIIVTLQYRYDALASPFSTKLKSVDRTLMPEEALPYINFGFSVMIADYYWITAIQDFVAWNGKNTFFLEYIKNITTLDPKFEYPYLFAILVIPQNKDVIMLDKIAVIVDKGIQIITTSWKLPYYLGTQYYLFTKSFTPAVNYLEIAAKTSNAPSGVYLTYSSFVSKNIEGYKASKEFIKVIYNNTDNETIKKLVTSGVEETVVSQMLEKGIFAYKTKYGRYPKNIEELAGLNYISLPKELLESFTISIDQKNGSFRVVAK